MKDFLDKLSSYNLFNYLLPGTIFAFLSKEAYFIPTPENLLLSVFLYYFLGLLISRIGSLIIEPILLKISFIKYSKYSDYLKVSKIDSKIEVMLETNNMYRTFISLFFTLLLLRLYRYLENVFSFPPEAGGCIAFIAIVILFLFSYKKQTNFILKRIENDKNN